MAGTLVKRDVMERLSNSYQLSRETEAQEVTGKASESKAQGPVRMNHVESPQPRMSLEVTDSPPCSQPSMGIISFPRV